MQKEIEDAVLAGTVIALRDPQDPIIHKAWETGLSVYVPAEKGRKKLTWQNAAAMKANDQRLKELAQ